MGAFVSCLIGNGDRSLLAFYKSDVIRVCDGTFQSLIDDIICARILIEVDGAIGMGRAIKEDASAIVDAYFFFVCRNDILESIAESEQDISAAYRPYFCIAYDNESTIGKSDK